MNEKRAVWISRLAWLIAILAVAAAGVLGWQKLFGDEIPAPAGNQPAAPEAAPPPEGGSSLPAPEFAPPLKVDAIHRKVDLQTIIPNRPRQEVITYTVQKGDSVFGIAGEFGITPESLLWSNYDILKDNPHAIRVGMELKIPPVDGVYYQWQEGDTFEQVAAEFKTDPEAILGWGGNKFDLTDPQVQPGEWVMIPGGQREFQQWIVPIIPRGAAGVSTGMYGAGACPGGYEGGAMGTGSFIWPSANHWISGNDYWSGHLAIDIGTALGEPIWAADSGVVVFAGWATGGYGNTVAIDHGNGYQTLYAHLSSVKVGCGQSVTQGQTIGFAGSTGNSTGPHLHFEVRYQGGFVNPWYVLP